jgi:hypothetical protein
VGFQRSRRQPEQPEPKEQLEPTPQERLVLPERQGPGRVQEQGPALKPLLVLFGGAAAALYTLRAREDARVSALTPAEVRDALAALNLPLDGPSDAHNSASLCASYWKCVDIVLLPEVITHLNAPGAAPTLLRLVQGALGAAAVPEAAVLQAFPVSVSDDASPKPSLSGSSPEMTAADALLTFEPADHVAILELQ